VTSCESTCPVAFGQFISNCPRLTAVCIAVGCLLARYYAWLIQPAAPSVAKRIEIVGDFDMCGISFRGEHIINPSPVHIGL